MTFAPLMSWPLARLLPAFRNADAAPVFEQVDGALLDDQAFRVSDSMGLDGAPSMVFVGAMPPYSRAIDRPSAASSKRLAVG